METYQFALQLYFTDPRPFADMRDLVAEALHCPLTVDESDSYRDESVYFGRVLGIDIYFEAAGQYADSNLYYLTGGTAAYLFQAGATVVALDEYIKEILARRGVQAFLSPADVAKR